MTATDRLTLRGMRFAGRHGVLPEERRTPQPFEVDLVLHLDLAAAAASDELKDTVNYAEVFERVRAVIEGPSHRLIESLAGTIADAVLVDPRIDELEVRVRKPQAPLPGEFEYVEAALVRRRLD